jgi:hypothetical protein
MVLLGFALLHPGHVGLFRDDHFPVAGFLEHQVIHGAVDFFNDRGEFYLGYVYFP